MHEAQMHHQNCFITLTYNTENLPENNSLNKRHAVLFLKRLRKSLSREDGDIGATGELSTTPRNKDLVRGHQLETTSNKTTRRKIRFYLAGEYGETYGRPHFHICLFGIDFHDKKYLRKTPAGSKIYTSEKLSKLWTYGFASVGELTFESAAYAARYIMKKINGKKQEQHYTKINKETGEIYKQEKEYNNMSRMPGLGSTWLTKYEKDVYPHGKVIVRGKKANAPRYYDKQYEKIKPEQYEDLQYGRHLEAIAHAHDQTPERLKAKETVAKAKAALLIRNI